MSTYNETMIEEIVEVDSLSQTEDRETARHRVRSARPSEGGNRKCDECRRRLGAQPSDGSQSPGPAGVDGTEKGRREPLTGSCCAEWRLPMAPRPAWKGYLKLSLVTCAVEFSNATTQSEKVSFRMLNRATGNTVHRHYIDSATRQSGRREERGPGLRSRQGRVPADRRGGDRGGRRSNPRIR